MLLLGVGIFFTQKIVWKPIKEHFYEMGRNPGYIPKGNEIRPLAFGFDTFLADLFWIRAVQYAGGNVLDASFDVMPQYLNLITDLDPDFQFAYHFGSLILPLGSETSNAADPLLRKAIKNNPHHQEHVMDIAYNAYYYQDKPEEAMKWYRKCIAEYNDCSKVAPNLLAYLEAKRGKYGISLQTWLQKLRDQGKKMSDEEWDIAKKKVEEAAKLTALQCSLENLKKQGIEVNDLSELLFQKSMPCPDITNLSESEKILLTQWETDFDLLKISEKTLTSPFAHNPFVLKDGKITTKLW